MSHRALHGLPGSGGRRRLARLSPTAEKIEEVATGIAGDEQFAIANVNPRDLLREQLHVPHRSGIRPAWRATNPVAGAVEAGWRPAAPGREHHSTTCPLAVRLVVQQAVLMTDWQAIQAEQFAPPRGGSIPALVGELVEMLASPDPRVRDELAFSALATWIDEGVVPEDLLRPLGDAMVERFRAKELQSRSFAALVLDVIVASRGVCEPRWVDAFERWYAAEDDLRGYDVQLGWLHAVAHGADLLGDLGLHAGVAPRRMLDLAVTRMLAPTATVWRDQEDDRLAHAIGKTLTRTGLTQDDATAWLDPVSDVLSNGEPGPTPAHVSNTLRTLRMVYLLVSCGVRTGGDEVAPVTWRATVLERLAAALHPATPWMW